jgi:peptide/nickel transport system substrate-binding protein
MAGVRAAYARFDGYVPRNEASSRTAGGKVAHMARVEWQVLPDPATAAGALTAGEVDWLEYPSPDLAPMLQRNRDVTVAVTDERSISVLRFNHLQAPFNNPGVRRALLGALDQSAYMTAAFGDDRALWREAGVFLSGTPMANDAGMAALRGPRDMEKVKRDLAAAGYAGEKTVLLQANDFPLLKALSEVAGDMMARAGMNVDVVAADWGTIGARRASKEPVERGGWSAFTSGFSGAGMLDPVAHLGLRATGARAWFGWPDSPELEGLRRDWMSAPDTAAQQQVARAIQERFWVDLPYMPLGEYSRMTAYRKNIVDIPVGLPSFWGVRRV